MPRPKKSQQAKNQLAEFKARNDKFSDDLSRLQKDFDNAYAAVRKFINAQKLEAVKGSLKKKPAR